LEMLEHPDVQLDLLRPGDFDAGGWCLRADPRLPPGKQAGWPLMVAVRVPQRGVAQRPVPQHLGRVGVSASARAAYEPLPLRRPAHLRLRVPPLVGIGLAAQAVAADLPRFCEWLSGVLQDHRLQPSDRFQALLRAHVRALLSGQTAVVHAQQDHDVSVFAVGRPDLIASEPRPRTLPRRHGACRAVPSARSSTQLRQPTCPPQARAADSPAPLNGSGRPQR
jgi:hypothetical protein